MDEELFTTNVVSEKTWEQIFNSITSDPMYSGNISGGGRLTGVMLDGASFASSVSGGRVEIFPDANTGIACYNVTSTKVFEVMVAGTNVGDVTIGRYSIGQGAMWDDSAQKFYIKGGLSASSLDIPDAVTANSFHVDVNGNTWWGSILIGDSVGKVLDTGAATFSNMTITGGSIGGATVTNIGYLGTVVADAVPTGLTCSSTAAVVASDGSISSSVVLTWSAIATNTFDHYQIRFKKATATYYTYIDSKTNTITIEGLVPNLSYNFGIASVNKFGSASAFSSDISQTTATSTTAPATVTSISATAGIQYVILEWTHNTETDLASYNIYRNTANNSATATLIGNCRTNYFVDGGLTGGQIYYYWLKAVNTSGLVSASFSTVQSATPRNVIDSDISSVAAIAASKVLIDGTVYLSNWRDTSDITKIDGGKIYAGSVTTTQLNFTPVQSTNVIASINASVEGITIDADNLTINAATTFGAGYDPTSKTAKVGGTYDSAASGARVRIFPDANTGIQIIDDTAADVFKCLVGGTDVGDVIIGNYAGGKGAKYDKSADTFTFTGILSAPTGTIGGFTIGATALTAGTTNIILDSSNKAISINDATYGNLGIQLQYNAGTPRVYIGNGSDKYFKFDGTNPSYSGNIKHTYIAGENISAAGKMLCIKNAQTDVTSPTSTPYIQCAYVDSSDPNSNSHGNVLETGQNGGTFYNIYIKVDVTLISQYIEKAVLRINLNTPPATSTTQLRIRRVTSDWTYTTVTWNTKPTQDDNYDWDSMNAGGSGIKEFDITQLVRAWKNKSLGGTGYDNYGIVLTIIDPEHAFFQGPTGGGDIPMYRRIEDGSSDGKVYLTDDNDFRLIRNFVGVSATSASANVAVEVYDMFGNPLTGNIVSSLVAGMPVFLNGTPGGFTQTATNLKYATLIGCGRQNGELLLNPQGPYLIETFPRYAVGDCVTGLSNSLIIYFNPGNATEYVFPPVGAMKCVIYWKAKDNANKLANGMMTVYKVGQTHDEWYGGGVINTTSSMAADWNGDVITITMGAEWAVTNIAHYPKMNVMFYSK